MKGVSFMHPPALYLEIGQSSLKALDGDDGLELSLERLENGRLSPVCVERLTLSLRVFLKKHNWRPHLRAICALGARGVSLRRLALPPGSEEELQRLLPLQVEREFPLAPDELAWGYRRLGREHPAGNAASAVQEVLVAAVKKEVLQDYADLLCACGLAPVFTLAALARSSLCSHPPKAYAVLDIGRNHSELISFEEGVPNSLRVLPWGGESITNALERNLAITHADAEKLKLHLNGEPPSSEEQGRKIQAVLKAEFHSLARSLQPNWIGERLYLSGGSAHLKDLAPELRIALGGSAECARLDVTPGEGRSAAIFGLRRSCEQAGGAPLLILQPASSDTESSARPTPWKWAVLACVLLLTSLSLRYAEAVFQKPRLARKIAEIKAHREELPNVDRELSFLQYLKTNQPPYLEPLFALATSAPAGTRIETLSLNAHGDLSLRASMRDSTQVVDLRSKLIDSGLFSTVVVEEQTPTPDRQKVVVRITGQWKRSANATPRAQTVKSNVTAKASNMTNAQLPMPKE